MPPRGKAYERTGQPKCSIRHRLQTRLPKKLGKDVFVGFPEHGVNRMRTQGNAPIAVRCVRLPRWDCEAITAPRLGGLNPPLNPRTQKTTPNPGFLPRNGAEAAIVSTPTGSRTPVFGLRTRRPGPLDDGGGLASL